MDEPVTDDRADASLHVAVTEAEEAARLAQREGSGLWDAEAHRILPAAYRRVGNVGAAALAEERALALGDAFRWGVRPYRVGLDAARRRTAPA